MTLHPQSQSFLDQLAADNPPGWSEMELAEARETFEDLPWFGDKPTVAETTDVEIAGVSVRIYKPTTDGSLDAIVYFHGGGWVLGSIESHDAVCRRLANASGAAVVSVDYRRPPEDPFPAALEDCFTVCDVLAMDHKSYGLTNKILVAGDSAGGNLSAAVCLMARDRGGPDLVGQVLIYPVLDGSLAGESYKEFAVGYGLTRETMKWFWQQYTGDEDSASRKNPLASPTHAESLEGLPPAHALIAEYDVLTSEVKQFASRLEADGVKTTTQNCEGLLHGFLHFAGAFDEAVLITDALAKRCREMLDQVNE